MGRRAILGIFIIFAIFLCSGIGAVCAENVQELDLGTIRFTEAPKTWTVEIPSDFTKVETGHYGVGETTPNKYGGWNGYLKVNGEPVWKFLSWNKEDGGHIQDYTLGQEVLEPTGRDKYLDATSFFRAGSNTVTYYHFTEGDGIGVKLRIFSGGTTSPAVTQAPTKTLPPTTSPSTTYTPTTRSPTTPSPGPSSDKKYLYGGVVAIVLLLVVAFSKKGKKPAEVKPEPPASKPEPEVRQTFIEREKVTEREKIPVFISKTLPSKCPSCGSPFAGKSGDACEYCGAIIRAENKVSGVE